MGNFYIKLEQAWGVGHEREMVDDLSIGDFGFLKGILTDFYRDKKIKRLRVMAVLCLPSGTCEAEGGLLFSSIFLI